MEADTAPAAVPDPNDRTQPAPQPGLFASVLAPVEPARPAAFSIDPAPTGTLAADDVAGASSAAFHGDENGDPNYPGKGGNSTGQTRGKESVVRAWLLAGAERWKKGAGANIKRLEVQKARAMAQQVKESRTVNRSEKHEAKAGPASGPASTSGSKSAAGGGASKGPAKKQDSSAGRAPKNTQNGRGTNGAGDTRAKAPAPAPAGPKTAPASKPAPAPKTPKRAKDPAPSKTDASGGSKRDSSGTDAKPAGGRTSKDGRTEGGSSSGKGGASSPRKDYAKDWKTPADEDDDKTPKRTQGKTSGRGKVSLLKKRPTTSTDRDASQKKADTPATPDAPETRRPAEPAAKKPESTKPADDPKKPVDKKGTSKDTPKAPTDAEKYAFVIRQREPLHTRSARETGYRDGNRAGRTAAQVRAYRDGVKDGWHQAIDAGEQEKQVLDQAHAQRKHQQQRDKDKDSAVPPTPAAPPKPTRAPAIPIPVTGIDASSVHLGDGANRTALARSEVRTLKGFERRLKAKTTVMQDVAERSRGLETHAIQQAAAVTRLMEDAKSVKGGEKLVGTLARLEDAAKAQAAQAADVHKRAARGADAADTVHTNAQTRYAAIYQAVVDSPETKGAEGRFYKEDAASWPN
ncbi:hypothetical protein [Streptomyces sp. NPDC056527]|uniref:hypothetical protein n=1 Tax=Streptomyces sp. NPDC056527 TaxID=3345853 RepID=UPI0036D1AF1E